MESKHYKNIECTAVETEDGVVVLQKDGATAWLVEKIENMTDENLAEFFGHFTEIMDAFYEPVEGVHRFALKPHVEPGEHTAEMFEGVEQYVPGMPYDVYIYGEEGGEA